MINPALITFFLICWLIGAAIYSVKKGTETSWNATKYVALMSGIIITAQVWWLW